ncbi:hypothetical protein QIY50_21225 [Pseudomonas putida]|nr:hypothetical protein QIY50_21225 [Pseudomonas putida]
MYASALAQPSTHVPPSCLSKSEPLGRVSTPAWVFNPSPGPDIIPRLHDAKFNGMAQLGLKGLRM